MPIVEGRAMAAAFDGGAITSDAGALLLGQADRAIRLRDRADLSGGIGIAISHLQRCSVGWACVKLGTLAPFVSLVTA